MNQNELYHYGVLGMRWGIRRYQPYPPGPHKGKYIGDPVERKRSNPLKERRQRKAEERRQKAEAERQEKERYKELDQRLKDHKKQLEMAVKYRSVLSTQELNDIIGHIQLEQKVAELTASRKSAGREFINRVLGNSSQKVLESAATSAGKAGLSVLGTKLGIEANAQNNELAEKFWKNFSLGVENQKKK